MRLQNPVWLATHKGFHHCKCPRVASAQCGFHNYPGQLACGDLRKCGFLQLIVANVAKLGTRILRMPGQAAVRVGVTLI